MLEVALMVAVLTAKTADLPPGAVLRLGDDRWRAGAAVDGLALSPDGSHIATWQRDDLGSITVRVWDATTGRLLRSTRVNDEFFHGLVWTPRGGFVAVQRVDPAPKGEPAAGISDDFRVWEFTDPNAAHPSLIERPPPGVNVAQAGRAFVNWLREDRKFTTFAMSADGRRVAGVRESSADRKHTIEVFELRATNTAAKLTRVRSLAIEDASQELLLSADGGTLVAFRHHEQAGSPFGFEIRTWDVDTGKAAGPFPVKSWVKIAALSPDGRTLALALDGGSDAGLFVDPMTGKARGEFAYPKRPGHRDASDRYWGGLVFTPDGKRLLATRGSRAFVADVATGKELARLEGHAANVLSVAVSADGRRIATADHAGLIRIWDAATFRPLNEPAGHRATIEHAELSPDGKRLVTWAADETVRVWDMTTGNELRAFAGAVKLGGPPCPRRQQPTFTPDGLAIVFSTTDRLLARDVVTGLEVPLPGEIAKLHAGFAVFAPDYKAVLTWDSVTAHLAVWDWPSGKKRFAFENIHDPVRPGFSPDGSSFFREDTRPTHYDAATGKELPPGWLAEPRYWAALVDSLRSNPRYLIAESFGSPQLITAGNGKPVPNCRIREPEDEWSWHGCGVTVSPDHRQFALGGLFEPHEVRVYEAGSGQFRRTFRGHRGKVRVLGFMPDGSRLLTSGADHTVLVWDARPQSMPLPDAMHRETDAAKLWATMCAGKADVRYLAMARLATDPDAAVKTARLRLKPATAPTAATLDRVLRDLGNAEFAVREAAEKELDGYGEPAAELVKARLAKIDSPEARRRADAFVTRWTGPGAAVRLADARAIELLESLGTTEAIAFLKALAAGDASASRTREAKRALERAGQ